MFKKLFPLALSGMLLFPLGKNINDEKEVAVREVELKEHNEENKNIFYDFESTLDGNIINTSFNSKIKDVSNIDYVGLTETDKEILDEVNYSFDIDLENNEIIYTASINSISISTSSSFDFSEGIINGEFDQENLKLTLKEISNYTSIDQVGLFDFLKRAAENAKRAIEEALKRAEELRQRAIAEAKRIAEEIRRRAEETARKAREIIEKAVGEAKSFVSDIINVKNILSGDIDSISRDIEGCKSYRDYSKAKSIFERAERVSRRAEELEVRVDNKVRSTSIMEALSQINPVRDAVRAIIEYAKKIFNKVKNVFEAIKSEHTARELFSSVAFSLADGLQNLIWSLAGSIYGGPKGVIENIGIVTTAISNYRYNSKHSDEIHNKDKKQGENPYYQGYIWNQGFVDAKMGYSLDFSDKGCGVVATYNLLKYYGVDEDLSKLILRFDLYNAFNLFGLLGTNPNYITKIIAEYGIDVKECGIDGYGVLDNKVSVNQASIACYLYISENQIRQAINKTLKKRYETSQVEEYYDQIDWDKPLVINNNIPLYFVNNGYSISNHILNLNLGDFNFDIELNDLLDCLIKTQEIGAHYEMIHRKSDGNLIGYNSNGTFNCTSFYDYLKEFGTTINGKKMHYYTACLAGFYVE